MRVGVVTNPHYEGMDELLERLAGVAASLGLELCLEQDGTGSPPETGPSLEESIDELDWVLTLGGDGTFLRGARIAGPRGLPVLGCNLGRLGFLTVVARDELEDALRVVASGECEEERRVALRVTVRRGDATGDPGPAFYSVNDAVVHKSGTARLITLRLWADDETIGQYSADGIIVATATGSTAYSLSAGGPILVPTMDGLIATPISPHTLAVRPVVLPATTRVTVEILEGNDDLALTVDGQPGTELRAGDRVDVVRSEHPVRLFRLPGYSFFSVLRRKLRWGDVRPSDV